MPPLLIYYNYERKTCIFRIRIQTISTRDSIAAEYVRITRQKTNHVNYDKFFIIFIYVLTILWSPCAYAVEKFFVVILS